jgi:predicted ATPase
LFETDNVILEGPDLAGKTTLYNEIHRSTGYKWNIQDRSCLSMLAYARLYNRDISKWRRKLWSELSNLNNRIILLRPSWATLVRRYEQRGDDIQDLTSLKKVHRIFQEEGDKILGLPTVVLPPPDLKRDELVLYCCSELKDLESVTPTQVGEIVRNFVEASPTDEVTPLQFTLTDQWPFPLADPNIMNDSEESKYYDNIAAGVMSNIEREQSGVNEYSVPQNLSTRRFIFTQDTCISLVHTMFRDGVLNVHAVCRSSDVVNTFTSDVRFLHYLSAMIHMKLSLSSRIPIRLHVRMHSAHVVKIDKKEQGFLLETG